MSMKKTVQWMLMLTLCCCMLSVNAQQAETFSIATLNVDGLPQKLLIISINGDGPGSDGSVLISQYLKQKGYDMVMMQEDFNYHEELKSMLEDDYQQDEWSGDVGIEGHDIDFLHLQDLRFECDGLMAFWKKNFSVTVGGRTAWTDGYGKFSHAWDMMVTKGFRRYEVTTPNGTELVVYNMHMDAEDRLDGILGLAKEDRLARESQWTQLREHIMERLDSRPVIVVGDVNSLYRRDRVKELFIDAIDATGQATVTDAWVALQNGGQYPEYEPDNRTYREDSEDASQETLDKVLCINPTGGQQLNPVLYTLDTEGYQYEGTVLGDHVPVAVTFEVVDQTVSAVSRVADNGTAETPTYYNINGQRISQPSRGLYMERTSRGTVKRIGSSARGGW